MCIMSAISAKLSVFLFAFFEKTLQCVALPVCIVALRDAGFTCSLLNVRPRRHILVDLNLAF
jgi:hypothetical protein